MILLQAGMWIRCSPVITSRPTLLRFYILGLWFTSLSQRLQTAGVWFLAMIKVNIGKVRGLPIALSYINLPSLTLLHYLLRLYHLASLSTPLLTISTDSRMIIRDGCCLMSLYFHFLPKWVFFCHDFFLLYRSENSFPTGFYTNSLGQKKKLWTRPIEIRFALKCLHIVFSCYFSRGIKEAEQK